MLISENRPLEVVSDYHFSAVSINNFCNKVVVIFSAAMKPPPAKRLANGRILSPMNKENKGFKKPYDTARALAAARAIVGTKAAGLNSKHLMFSCLYL